CMKQKALPLYSF
nr:immunoglobulin light chain junction region [Macaca mulatta]